MIDSASKNARYCRMRPAASKTKWQLTSTSTGVRLPARSRIVAEVWGRSWAGANRTLDVHVATLRTKLGRPELVQTVRGVGYRLGLPEPIPGDE